MCVFMRVAGKIDEISELVRESTNEYINLYVDSRNERKKKG